MDAAIASTADQWETLGNASCKGLLKFNALNDLIIVLLWDLGPTPDAALSLNTGIRWKLRGAGCAVPNTGKPADRMAHDIK